jgi:hypothetical protein
MISAPQHHLSPQRTPFGKQSTRGGDGFIRKVERTESEEPFSRIRLYLEGCLNDVSILGTRRGGACSVVVSEDVGVLAVQVLFVVSKFIHVQHSLV